MPLLTHGPDVYVLTPGPASAASVPEGLVTRNSYSQLAFVVTVVTPTDWLVIIGFGFADMVPVQADGGGATDFVALHDAFVPPFMPLHDHCHGPLPVTAVGVPLEHKLTGAVERVWPLSTPH